MEAGAPKRRRISPPPQPTYSLDDEEDSYVPYVPVKQRREALISKLSTKHHGVAGPSDKDRDEERDREEDERLNGKAQKGTAQTLLMEAQEVKRLKAIEGAIRKREGGGWS